MNDKIIYEVLRVINNIPIFLEAHLKRMRNSFKLVGEEFKFSDEEIATKIDDLIRSENKNEGNIKITYGIDEKVLRVSFIEHSYPNMEMYINGVDAILFFGERENPNAKIVNDDFRGKVNKEIKDKDAYEAILVDKDGNITEGSKSNIFMIKDNVILTSPAKAVLPGVTRNEIIEIAKKLKIQVQEIEYKYTDIGKLDGMFISGTSPKVLPIRKVNNIRLNADNHILRTLMKEYNDEIKKYMENCK